MQFSKMTILNVCKQKESNHVKSMQIIGLANTVKQVIFWPMDFARMLTIIFLTVCSMRIKTLAKYVKHNSIILIMISTKR